MNMNINKLMDEVVNSIKACDFRFVEVHYLNDEDANRMFGTRSAGRHKSDGYTSRIYIRASHPKATWIYFHEMTHAMVNIEELDAYFDDVPSAEWEFCIRKYDIRHRYRRFNLREHKIREEALCEAVAEHLTRRG